ncbi:MAG: hypothetical protein AAGN46_00825 [Acidobacteriota bacterium]
MKALPAHARRLLPELDDPDGALDDAELRDGVILRLLEEGDSDDLRALVARVGESMLAAAVQRGGDRSLSRRSWRFAGFILGMEEPDTQAPSAAEALWPL